MITENGDFVGYWQPYEDEPDAFMDPVGVLLRNASKHLAAVSEPSGYRRTAKLLACGDNAIGSSCPADTPRIWQGVTFRNGKVEYDTEQ